MAAPSTPTRIVRTYGRGAAIGLISPLLAWGMARLGYDGWQQRAIRDMEDDAAEMARKGYHVVTSEERALPPFGIAYYVVTYERSG